MIVMGVYVVVVMVVVLVEEGEGLAGRVPTKAFPHY